MVEVEPIVSEFYDYLDKGKLMGLKCKKCGSYEFPPAPVCQKCGGSDMEWAELSGDGELLFFTVIESLPEPRFADLVPNVVGSVRMREGPGFTGIVWGLDVERPEEELKKCPRKVKAEIREVAGVKIVTFAVV